MEEELKCVHCNDFYCNPVLLPCFHSICYACALHLQEKKPTYPTPTPPAPSLSTSNSYALKTTSKYSINHIGNNQNQQSIDNLSSAIANAALSASNIIALANSTASSSSTLQQTLTNASSSISPHSSVSDHLCQNRALSITDLGSSIMSDLDKLSVFSENDSGLGGLSTTTLTALINISNSLNGSGVNSGSNQSGSSGCSSNSSSRPSSSYLSSGCSSSSSGLSPTDFNNRMIKKNLNFSIANSTSSSSLPLPPPLPTFSLFPTYLTCPKCNNTAYLDDSGVDSLPKNTCLENIVERYTEARKLTLKCQMCPPSSSETAKQQRAKEKDAMLMCEQCEIFYCEECKDAYHPMRGPLSKHVLVAPKIGRDFIRRKNRSKESKCIEHVSENVIYYCLSCKRACCNLCVNEDNAHLNHQIQPIQGFCKSQKVNKKNLNALY